MNDTKEIIKIEAYPNVGVAISFDGVRIINFQKSSSEIREEEGDW